MATIDALLEHIRWEAEAALSGLDNLPEPVALSSSRMSFEEILDTLNAIDNADRSGKLPGANAVGGAKGEAAILNLDASNVREHEPLGSPASAEASIGDLHDSLKERPSAVIEQAIGSENGAAPADSSDNVLSLFDRRAHEILR